MAGTYVGRYGKVLLYDMNWAMMAAGRQKRLEKNKKDAITYIQGDAECMSIADNSVDAIIVGFGVRNLTHLKQGFTEMHRILKKGGKMVCLEFSRPDNPVFRVLYDFYSFNIMPLIGQLFTGSSKLTATFQRPSACSHWRMNWLTYWKASVFQTLIIKK